MANETPTNRFQAELQQLEILRKILETLERLEARLVLGKEKK